MAATLALLPNAQLHHHQQQQQLCANYLSSHGKPPPSSFPPKLKHPSHPLCKSNRSNCSFFTPFFSASPSPDSPSSSPVFPYPQNPLSPGGFLTPEELEKLQLLEKFTYSCKLGSGRLCIRVMRVEEIDITSKLLAESFAESMLMPMGYATLLGFLVKQYLIERRSLMPYAVTLVGYYRGEEVDYEEEKLAGTVEMSFDQRGANASPPTPTPPKNLPYICNMTVQEQLRRRGIGWHLLKASEELISHMTFSKEIYLHCRMIDSAPFNMYKKAGYDIVNTDTILVLFKLQRRKYLMCKRLPASSDSSEMSVSELEGESSS